MLKILAAEDRFQHGFTNPERQGKTFTKISTFSHRMTGESVLRFQLLNARHLPARLLAEEVAVILGFKEHDIAKLVSAGVLKPLACGKRNAVKYFHADEVLAVAKDRKLMDKATRAAMQRGAAGSGRKMLVANQSAAAAVAAAVGGGEPSA